MYQNEYGEHIHFVTPIVIFLAEREVFRQQRKEGAFDIP
jgi:hypothetical protein